MPKHAVPIGAMNKRKFLNTIAHGSIICKERQRSSVSNPPMPYAGFVNEVEHWEESPECLKSPKCPFCCVFVLSAKRPFELIDVEMLYFPVFWWHGS